MGQTPKKQRLGSPGTFSGEKKRVMATGGRGLCCSAMLEKEAHHGLGPRGKLLCWDSIRSQAKTVPQARWKKANAHTCFTKQREG